MTKAKKRPKNYMPWRPNTKDYPDLGDQIREAARKLGVPAGTWLRIAAIAKLNQT